MGAPRLVVRTPEDERDLKVLAPILDASLGFGGAAAGWYDDVGRENLRVAALGRAVVGGYAIYPIAQRFGGRAIGAAGIAGVAVAPEHRASGVGKALMRDALREATRRGLPLSTLYPATVPVYRRAGFEIAGSLTFHRIVPSAIDVRDGEPAIRPLTDADRPAIEACEVERSRRENGPLVRSAYLWKRMFAHPERTVHRYGIDGPHGLDGFVVYHQPPVGRTNHYEILVRDWAALTPAAGRRLLSFFAAHRSLCDAVILPGPPAEPLLLHLRETPLAIEKRFLWMLRLVDVRAALEARGYPTGLSCRVALDVADSVVPANAGRFTLDVSGSGAHVRRGGSGSVRIDVRGLAALFSAHQSPSDLVRVGLLVGPDRDLAALGTLFAGPAPWMAEIF